MGSLELVTILGIGLLTVGEFFLARNRLTHGRYDRWLTNIGLGFINELIRFGWLFIVASYLATLAWQPFDASVLGPFVGALLAFFVTDFSLYWVHQISHRIRWFWRLHRTHHCDLDLDLSTSFRHHPAEVMLNLFVFFFLLGVFGFTPTQLLPMLILQRVVSLWSHANIRLHEPLERALAWVVVTPRVHQIHHSAWRPETDSNYGQVLTIWDRLFGTYISPDTEPCPSQFGLERFRSDEEQRLTALLVQPIRS